MVEDCITLCFLVRLDDGYYCRWCSHIHCMNPTLARLTGVVAFQQSLIVMSCPLSPQVCSSIPSSAGFPGPTKPDGDLADLSTISVKVKGQRGAAACACAAILDQIYSRYTHQRYWISVCYAMRFWAGVIVAWRVLSPYCSFLQDSNPCLLCLCQCLMCPYNFKALSEG